MARAIFILAAVALIVVVVWRLTRRGKGG